MSYNTFMSQRNVPTSIGFVPSLTMQDTNLQKIHKTSFKYNKFYTNKLKLQQVLH